MIRLDIFYENGSHNAQLCNNQQEMEWLIYQMFNIHEASRVIQHLIEDGFINLPGTTDQWFDPHFLVRRIEADFTYDFPKPKAADPNELKLKIYDYLDKGFLPEEISEALDISLDEVQKIIHDEEKG